MLAPRDRGGYEAHPAEFFETVMNTAALAPSSGWVAGVVGVHPWELGMADPTLQEELWGQDQDTWVASPYAPMGVAKPVAGGYALSGRWSFSSGTDSCDWVVIGGLVPEPDSSIGNPPQIRHFVLPRADYQIVDGSWEVIGLVGTGSKDLIVSEAFVPEHRTINNAALIDGSLAEERRPGNPLYAMPFGVVFSYAISSATIGITEGALAAFVNDTQSLKIPGHRTADQQLRHPGLTWMRSVYLYTRGRRTRGWVRSNCWGPSEPVTGYIRRVHELT